MHVSLVGKALGAQIHFVALALSAAFQKKKGLLFHEHEWLYAQACHLLSPLFGGVCSFLVAPRQFERKKSMWLPMHVNKQRGTHICMVYAYVWCSAARGLPRARPGLLPQFALPGTPNLLALLVQKYNYWRGWCVSRLVQVLSLRALLVKMCKYWRRRRGWYVNLLFQAPQFTRFTSTKVQILARLLRECALPAFGRVRARAAARMLTHAEAC